MIGTILFDAATPAEDGFVSLLQGFTDETVKDSSLSVSRSVFLKKKARMTDMFSALKKATAILQGAMFAIRMPL